METARIQISGEGWAVGQTPSHPEGIIFSGGYDAETNIVHLAGVAGHPQGMKRGGGDASKVSASGLRLFLDNNENIDWADDSLSLPRRLSEEEREAVQQGFQRHFTNQTVIHIEKLEDIARLG